jgi:hypothetical protein
MTFSYTTKTQVGYAYASVILPDQGNNVYSVSTPYGFVTFDGTLTWEQAQYVYGSELLPLPVTNAPPNSGFVDEYDKILMFKLLPRYSSQIANFAVNSLNGAIDTRYVRVDSQGGYIYLGHYPRPLQASGPYTGYGDPIYEPDAELDSRPVVVFSRKRYLVENFTYTSPKKPSYKDLLSGYYLDSDRVVRSYPIITSPIDQKATISYYRQNKHESIGFPSIDWMVYEVDLIANVPKTLPIIDCVLGTLHCDNQNIVNLIKNTIINPAFYPQSTYFEDGLPDLFNHWRGLAQAIDIPPSIPANAVSGGTKTEVSRAVRVLAANNNYWNNQSISIAVDQLPPSPNTHPLFKVDQTRGYNWHIKPQSDGSFGDLVMNSRNYLG